MLLIDFHVSAIIYSFHVETPSKVGALAKANKIPIRNFNVIYKLIDNLKDEISSKLPPVQVEEILGERIGVVSSLE